MSKQNSDIEIIELTEENMESMVYTIRGVKVMLDFDLARIYGYETKRFNEQVKNNIEKFPEDFMFQLTSEEVDDISRSQNVTAQKSPMESEESSWSKKSTLNENEPVESEESSWSQKLTLNKSGNLRGTNVKYRPYAFTEQGIYMLMTVLKGDLAIKQSIALVRLFKQMKDCISENRSLVGIDSELINNKFSSYDKRFEKIESKLAIVMNNFIDPSSYKHFFILKGEMVEAELAYQQIYSLAKHSIIVIDDYISLKTIQLLKAAKEDVDIIVFSDNVARDSVDDQMLADFNKEYNRNIKIYKNGNIFHDRYIVIDYTYPEESIYHSGSSSKDAGNKASTIIRIDEMKAYRPLINDLLRKIV